MKASNKKNKTNKNIRLLLIKTWRLCILGTTTSFLFLLLIDNGWKKIYKDSIYITGNKYTSKEKIINEIKIDSGLKIITINPNYIESILLKELPLKAVKVNRRILPPELHISILERVPVAYATRKTYKGVEKGMIDEAGFWIPISNNIKINTKLDQELIVDGWTKRHRKSIAEIFKNRTTLGSELQKIDINPNGEINLQTKDFKIIYLGLNKELLDDQIKLLPFLIRSLPEKFTTEVQTNIDLKDPQKPKLLTP